MTSLEEATTEILSPVVEMICDTLPELAQSLNKLVVALELDGQQVSSAGSVECVVSCGVSGWVVLMESVECVVGCAGGGGGVLVTVCSVCRGCVGSGSHLHFFFN